MQRLLKDGGRVAGAFGYWRETGRFMFSSPKRWCSPPAAVAKRGNDFQFLGVHRRRRHAWRMDVGADLMDMEFMQFHPTGMVWPPSVRGMLVTEGVRGDGGTLKNTRTNASCSTTSRSSSKPRPPTRSEEADAWYER